MKNGNPGPEGIPAGDGREGPAQEVNSSSIRDEKGPDLPSTDELYGQLLRLQAEFENYRKRMDRERPEWVRLGEARLWDRLLPVYDALLNAHDYVLKHSGQVPPELEQGLGLVFKEFTRIFEAEGVKAIESVDKPYHHDFHEVLGAVETDKQPEGVVVKEIQRGYTWQGKVLRPAKVLISKPRSMK